MILSYSESKISLFENLLSTQLSIKTYLHSFFISLSERFLFTQLPTIDSYILIKSITSYKKKSLQKSLHSQQKKLSSLKRDCNLPIFTANETITNLTQYELSQEESDLLKAGLYFQSSQIKFENPKFSLPLKRFTFRFLTTLSPRKPKVR